MTDHRTPRVLVTGASIAGPALAWGLRRAGFEVTLLERSPGQREAGQNIDVRSIGRDVVRRMGLEDVVMANLTGEEGTRYVDERGRPYASVPRREGHDGPTAEVEVLRGVLAGLLVAEVADDVDLRYGDFVTAVAQDARGVDVDLDSGAQERFDLLLVAEGRSSRTRRLLFADQTSYHDHGVTLTFGTLDREASDTDQWDWYTAPRGRVAAIRPDNLGTMRASLSFTSEPMGFEALPRDAQLAVLRERFRGAGWQTERILDGFDARPEEFYAQRMEQVVTSTWSQGRVALVGDAAWGSGPTGMGTTLSLVGAHVLAGELAATPDDVTGFDGAFARYERLLRGWVDSAQGLPPGGARLLHPHTRAGITAVRLLHRVIGLDALRGPAEKYLLTSARGVPELPDYPLLRAEATAAARRS